jgi:hypothetical protein
MATDIGSLAAELDAHGVRLGIGHNGLYKLEETLALFSRYTLIPL